MPDVRGPVSSCNKAILRLIAALSRVVLRPEDAKRAREAAKQVSDWREVLACARALAVSPLMSVHFDGELNDAGVPAEVLREFWLDRVSWARRCEKMLDAAARPLKLLADEGIRFAPLKGAAFAGSLYPEPGTRLFSDIDVLVPPEDFERATTILASSQLDGGWRIEALKRGMGPARRRDYYNRDFMVRSPDGSGCSLEVHQAFKHRKSFDIAPEQLWQRATRDENCAFAGASCLTWEDHLLHAPIHHAWHGYRIDLKGFVDISEIVRQKPVDWDKVVKRAGEWGAKTAAYYSFSIARAFLGAPIPEEVIEAFRPGRLRRACIERFVNVSGPPFYREPRRMKRAVSRLLVLPLMDSFLRQVYFVAFYSWMRISDRLAGSGRTPLDA